MLAVARLEHVVLVDAFGMLPSSDDPAADRPPIEGKGGRNGRDGTAMADQGHDLTDGRGGRAQVGQWRRPT